MTARIQAVLFLLLVAVGWTAAVAQDRLTSPIDNSVIVALKGSVSPLARPQNDLGPLDPSMNLRVTLVLKPSSAQEAARDKLLADQQNPNSPDYHKWLTPEQCGERFGLSRRDINTISRWLTSQGFQVVEVSRARNWIAFTGTVGQVELAFHTQLHRFTVDGEDRFSNTVEPSIPRALNGVVLGLHGLNNFKAKSLRVQKPKMKSNYSDGFGDNYLAPDDIATIYDIAPLYAAGIDGTGMKIAIMGQTDVHMTDIEQFRAGFNLPANDPTVVLASGCTDPGFTSDEGEADLDLEWSGAVARNATVIFVTCDGAHDGVFGSLMYTIGNNLAPVISMSYGLCEQTLGSSFETQYESILEQANVQGQTLLVSSGDNNAAGCDNQDSASIATNGLGVNGLASPLAATAVGGTEFDADVSDPGTYWDSSNSVTGRSAKQYINELAWNDGDLGTGLVGGLWGTGGGASIFFSKPNWQTGAGVPNDGARDLPDVAMTASGTHDGYVFCTTASCAGGVANAVSNGSIVGGTSAAAPVFAGIITLLNHYLSKNGTPPGLGNINPQLYSMAASTPAAFHDIPGGDYSISNTPSGNAVNCQSGTANCPAASPFQFGFLTGGGYDQVTGLGSVDANVFVTSWGGGTALTPTTTTLTISSSSVTVGTSVTLTATVSPVPSGGETITFTDTNSNSNLGTAPIASGVATFTSSSLASGSYNVVAKYAGDSTLAASTSAASALTVQKSSTTTTTTTISISLDTVKVGDSVTLTATISPAPPNGETVTFTNGVSGTAIGSGTTSSGSAIFTSTSIPGGSYNVVASYPGDKTMAASASTTSTLNIQDFSLGPNSLTINISTPGQSGSGTLTFGLMGGLNQAPTFACSGLPAESTCTFAAASATSETVKIATTAASAMRSSLSGKGTGMLYALLLPGFFGLVLPAANRKRALRSVLPVLTMLVLLTLWLAACGGNGNGGTGTGPHDTGTPVGQTNVTVTGTESGVTHTVTINLNVQ